MNKKVYLKFRCEELIGGQVLFQILEQDERSRNILNDNHINYNNDIISCEKVEIFDKYIYLRGNLKKHDFDSLIIKDRTKEQIINQLKEFHLNECFEKDFIESSILLKETDFDEPNLYRQYCFYLNGKEKLLEYCLWVDEVTYFKVYFAHKCLTNIVFNNNTYKESGYISPSIYFESFCFRGHNKHLNHNVDYSSHPYDIDSVNKQVKKYLEKYFNNHHNDIILKEIEPNIYELS